MITTGSMQFATWTGEGFVQEHSPHFHYNHVNNQNTVLQLKQYVYKVMSIKTFNIVKMFVS